MPVCVRPCVLVCEVVTLNDVQDEAVQAEAREMKHVPNGTICQGRGEHWDVVLPTPVVDGSLIIDFLAQAVNHGAGRPDLLLCTHQNQPVSEKRPGLLVVFPRAPPGAA